MTDIPDYSEWWRPFCDLEWHGRSTKSMAMNFTLEFTTSPSEIQVGWPVQFSTTGVIHNTKSPCPTVMTKGINNPNKEIKKTKKPHHFVTPMCVRVSPSASDFSMVSCWSLATVAQHARQFWNLPAGLLWTSYACPYPVMAIFIATKETFQPSPIVPVGIAVTKNSAP